MKKAHHNNYYSSIINLGFVWIVIAVSVGLVNECYAQTDSVLTYTMTQDISVASDIKNFQHFKKYISKDGNIIIKGTRLEIGRPTRYGDFKYVSGEWLLSRVDVNLDSYDRLNMSFHGEPVIVDEIVVWHSKQLNKKSKLEVYLKVLNPKLILKTRTVINYEVALKEGEIIYKQD